MLSLLPVILGVGFACVLPSVVHFVLLTYFSSRTYGDYYYTMWGLVLTLLGTVLAALKTVITNVLQTNSTTTSAGAFPASPKTPHHPPVAANVTRLKLHPLDLLLRMSPLAFVQCIIYAYLSGELHGVHGYGGAHFTTKRLWALGINGAIAFGLNIVSFTANKKSGPLTMTVAGG